MKALTERVRAALEGATLQADDVEAIRLAAFAESLLPPQGAGLEGHVAVRRLLLERAEHLRSRTPERLSALSARLGRFRRVLGTAGLTPDVLDAGTARAEIAASTLAVLLVALFLAPGALVGLLAHAPAYQLIGPLAKRLAREDTDIVATIKVLGAFVFFPLTWIGLGTAAGLAWSLPLGLLVGLGLPLLGWFALLLLERWEATAAALRALGLSLFRRRAFARLVAERESLVREMAALDAQAAAAE